MPWGRWEVDKYMLDKWKTKNDLAVWPRATWYTRTHCSTLCFLFAFSRTTSKHFIGFPLNPAHYTDSGIPWKKNSWAKCVPVPTGPLLTQMHSSEWCQFNKNFRSIGLVVERLRAHVVENTQKIDSLEVGCVLYCTIGSGIFLGRNWNRLSECRKTMSHYAPVSHIWRELPGQVQVHTHKTNDDLDHVWF